MPFQLISASGIQHGLIINSDGSINISGTLSANVDNIFVQSGTFFQTSGNVFVVSGNAWTGVGSVQTPNPVFVTPSGTFFVSGNVVNTGSVAITNLNQNIFLVSGNNWAGVGSVYRLNTGSVVSQETSPKDASKNNPLFNLTFSGGVLTRAVQFIGAGSFVKDLSYSGTTLAQAGSWY